MDIQTGLKKNHRDPKLRVYVTWEKVKAESLIFKARDRVPRTVHMFLILAHHHAIRPERK